jgi:hypothetical protein
VADTEDHAERSGEGATAMGDGAAIGGGSDGGSGSQATGKGGGLAAVILVVVACWLLAAHFLRSFDLIFVLFYLFTPLILLIRSVWAVRIMQVILFFGAFEWLTTTVRLVGDRRFTGEPAGRMVLIMSAVILFTLGAGAALESRGARRRFGRGDSSVFSAGPVE